MSKSEYPDYSGIVAADRKVMDALFTALEIPGTEIDLREKYGEGGLKIFDRISSFLPAYMTTKPGVTKIVRNISANDPIKKIDFYNGSSIVYKK
jgi:hypothetical protein